MTAPGADIRPVARAVCMIISIDCRVNLLARTGATMTAIGHEVYLYGGQVRVISVWLLAWAFGLSVRLQGWQAVLRSQDLVALLQDPVTGICFDDILILDTKTWRWSAVEVC